MKNYINIVFSWKLSNCFVGGGAAGAWPVGGTVEARQAVGAGRDIWRRLCEGGERRKSWARGRPGLGGMREPGTVAVGGREPAWVVRGTTDETRVS